MQLLKIEQKLVSYDRTGEIELISLHKVKHRIASLGVNNELKGYLVDQLLKENEAYRVQSKSQKYCLTPDGIDNATYNTRIFLEDQFSVVKHDFGDLEAMALFESSVLPAIETNVSIIKHWFADNYDNLFYDTNGSIPWPIVQRMRGEFVSWAEGKSTFDTPIIEIIEEVATDKGYDTSNYDSYEDLWVELKKFTKK